MPSAIAKWVLPVADGAGEQHVFRALDPAAARELGDLRGVNTVGGGEVELVERLGLREARVAQAMLHGVVASRLQLDGEHLVQVVFERPLLLACLTAERFEHARRTGHLERARVLANQLGHDDVAAHWTPPSSAS
jgi:hypothetical protein